MGVWYCTREDVKNALDSASTARNDWQVDQAIEGSARDVEALLRRTFRPVLATKYFDWPDLQRGRPWRLWLNGSELIELTSLTAGGVAIPNPNLFLEPANYGPPFSSIEVDLGSVSAFSAGDTHQRAIAAAGLWGHSNDEEQVGVLAANLGASVSATASITWSTPRVGVGDVLRIGSERMIVTERAMVDTTQDLQADMAASSAAVTVAVTAGTAFAPGQVLLLDSERMLVVDVAGNNLTVKRAWDGSVLGSHSASSIYSMTGTDVDRAQLGTTLAAHSTSDPIYRHKVPGLVRQLNKAEAINELLQEQGGYARVQRSEDSQQDGFGDGLPDLRKRARAAYGRKARSAAI
jgi:hypothetical protein